MGSAPKEIELKLEVAPKDVARIERHLRRHSRLAGPPRTDSLISTYFDTDRNDLHHHGVSLRVRRNGARRIQTIKAANGAGLIERAEWEKEIDSDEPDLAGAAGTALAPVLTGKVRKGLRPVFTTRAQRAIYSLEDKDWSVELSIDRGEIKTGRRSAPLSEIELELKRGDPARLFELARVLEHLAPLNLGVKSKSERGYALMERKPRGAEDGGKIPLSKKTTTAEAFRAIAHACVRQLVANVPALQRGDAEALHQMRVALRRLRAALSFFSAAVADQKAAAIKSALKWMTGELGPARELDVFLTRIVAPARQQHPHDKAIAALHRDVTKWRAQAFARAIAAARSARFRTMVLDVVAWLESGPWTRGTDKRARTLAVQPIVKFAARELSRRRRKIKKKGRAVAELAPPQRHKLRIAAKKLRYAVEFLASLYSGDAAKKGRKTLLDALKRLQQALGELNDIAAERTLGNHIAQAASRKAAGGEAFVAGLLVGRDEAQADKLIKQAVRAHADFAACKPFWK